MMCVDGSNNFGGALCIMYEYLLSCIVFHEKEYKDKLCGAASYIEIYMICMCICVFFLSEVAIISKLYFNLLDRSFVLITIQFDIINFFLIYSNTILKNSMHIALTKSIFKKRSILWCYTAVMNVKNDFFHSFVRDPLQIVTGDSSDSRNREM